MQYHEIAETDIEPNLWTIEMSPHELRTCAAPPRVINERDLAWLKRYFGSGARLAEQAPFGRAIETFDGARWMHSPGAAIITIWAAIETLFEPGRRQITKRLSTMIAAFLEEKEEERSRTYQVVRSLYSSRGGAAHASEAPETEELLLSFEIARRIFIKCIEENRLPSSEKLLQEWKSPTGGQ